jgi:hypothetical protein
MSHLRHPDGQYLADPRVLGVAKALAPRALKSFWHHHPVCSISESSYKVYRVTAPE